MKPWPGFNPRAGETGNGQYIKILTRKKALSLFLVHDFWGTPRDCPEIVAIGHMKSIISYRAYSTLRTSRITVTLISPGYCISLSIFLAMSRAILALILSSTSLASTITRTSRPAWMA